MAFPREFQSEPYDYADETRWPDARSLSVHIKTLMMDREITDIKRQDEALHSQIGHAVFELALRRREEAHDL